MQDELKKKLVTRFREKNSTVVLTYEQWISNRENDWKRIITDNKAQLTRKITPECTLYDELTSAGIFHQRRVEDFKHKGGKCEQVSALMDGLMKRPFGDFEKFCFILIKMEQAHIIVELLTPELPQEKQSVHSAAEDESDNTTEGQDNHAAEKVSFNWQDTMKLNLVELGRVVDPDHGLLSHLLAKGVIQDFNIDNFKLEESRTNRAIRLLEHIRLRSTSDFIKFCQALDDTNQGNVVTQYLSKEGLCRARKRDNGDRQVAQARMHPSCTEKELQLLGSVNWKEIILNYHLKLLDEMIVTDDLITQLMSLDVINFEFSEKLKEKKIPSERVGCLLDYMQLRSDKDYLHLRKALEAVDQGHIVVNYLMIEPPFDETSQPSVCENGENVQAVRFSSGRVVEQSVDKETLVKTGGVIAQSQDLGEPDVLMTDKTHAVPMQSAQANLGHGDDGKMAVQETATDPVSAIESGVFDAVNFATHAGVPPPPPLPPSFPPLLIADVRQGIERVQIAEQPSVFTATTGPVPIKGVQVKLCTNEFYALKKSEAYSMSSTKRGKCLIFNMENFVASAKRAGTRVDGKLLMELFTQLQFNVMEFMDYKAEAVRETLTRLSQDSTLQQDQCLVLFFLSHGNLLQVGNKMMDCIICSDDQHLTTDEILFPFTDNQCYFLENKPRLVFFQACRGHHCDQMDADKEETMVTPPPIVNVVAPSYRDFLIGYPTQSSYRSFRNVELGSWYINALVGIIMEHACSMDVCAMLNMLNGQVSQWGSNTGSQETSNKTQIANFVSHFRKPYFYFFPGIIDDTP